METENSRPAQQRREFFFYFKKIKYMAEYLLRIDPNNLTDVDFIGIGRIVNLFFENIVERRDGESRIFQFESNDNTPGEVLRKLANEMIRTNRGWDADLIVTSLEENGEERVNTSMYLIDRLNNFRYEANG